ncbi:hypothetical protein T4B_5032 [Trichinella pseudospiralis]|uniref:Uncharacterized protein n=1 Tax=Trichinella pseudospiralis TaxID=6337 RepID=A0A0V1GSN0_TRIPS|nr:hypothetical protein T4B_5032 [Trichinella pseudospiralis]
MVISVVSAVDIPQNVDVNLHICIYWNSCRCFADRDMGIHYDVMKHRLVFNPMSKSVDFMFSILLLTE